MGKQVLRADLAQDLHLEMLVLYPTLGGEAGEIEVEPGIMYRALASRSYIPHWHRNLFPRAVFLAPEDRAPLAIKILKAPIAPLKPLLKGCATRGAVTTVTVGDIA